MQTNVTSVRSKWVQGKVRWADLREVKWILNNMISILFILCEGQFIYLCTLCSLITCLEAAFQSLSSNESAISVRQPTGWILIWPNTPICWDSTWPGYNKSVFCDAISQCPLKLALYFKYARLHLFAPHFKNLIFWSS